MLHDHRALTVYAVASLALSANLLFLWVYSGIVRARTKETLNEEDAPLFKVTKVAVEPDAVARVLRAHQNALALVVPFSLLGLVFVLAGGAETTAMVVFGAFVVARWAHSLAYLGRAQPLRTLSFGASALALVGLVVAIGLRLSA